MKTEKKLSTNKKVSENNNSFGHIELTDIVFNSYNPRKTFNEDELKELTESIRTHGVIQPITVRPLDNGKYEVVCGERRLRASMLAELVEIPACIKSLSDEEALEFAITENLQRKDVSPIEESVAFNKLLETQKYTIADLAQKFGKSDVFIRTRLKLTDLISDFASMVENDTLALTVANVLANCSKEIQEDVFQKHYGEKVESWNSWYGKNGQTVKTLIEKGYSNNLSSFHFDKTACNNCCFNTANFTLFNENANGKCINKTCLAKKNNEFIISQIQIIQMEHPEYNLCKSFYYTINDEITEVLQGMGYDIMNIRTENTPEMPEEPVQSEYEDNEEYESDMNDYKNDLEAYANDLETFNNAIESGEIIPCIYLADNNAVIAYVSAEKEKESTHNHFTEEERQVSKLEGKIERNDQLRGEKKVGEYRELTKNIVLPVDNLNEIEEAIFYFFLIGEVRTMNYSLIGIEKDSLYSVSADEKLNIAKNLTIEQKNLIVREYINNHLRDLYQYSQKADDSLLRLFLKLHDSNRIDKIDEEINSSYDKRNSRLGERIKDLMEKQVSTEDEVTV